MITILKLIFGFFNLHIFSYNWLSVQLVVVPGNERSQLLY